MEIMGDGNAIYVSGTGKNNRVLNNFIHDIPAQNINASIRCDDDQHETIIENNVITRVCGEGIIWKGKNTIRNNILYDIRDTTPDGTPCVHKRGYLVMPSTAGGRFDRAAEHRRLANRRAGAVIRARRSRRPRSRSSMQPAMLRTCEADYNLYFNTAEPGWGQKHLDAQRPLRHRTAQRRSRPAVPQPGERRLPPRADSPALKLGFQPIDISKVGPRKKAASKP